MLYLIFGKDALARKEALEKIRSQLDSDESLATNTAHFEARKASPGEVMAACDTLPFLGGSRLVIAGGVLESANPRKRSTKAEEGASEDDAAEEPDPGKWAALAEYASRMPPTTTLVLIDEDGSKTNPLLKALRPHAKVIECELPADRALGSWVSARAKQMGLKLDVSTANLLAELVGPDPYMLASELAKLLAYTAGEVVHQDDVRELVSRAKEHKGWDLTDAILDGKGATATRVLSEMLEDGQHPQMLIGTIAGRLRRAAIVRDMLDRGESSSAIAERINMKPGYGLDKVIEQTQKHTLDSIREAYARLIQADLDTKRGDIEDHELALELAVHELAERNAAPAVRR